MLTDRSQQAQQRANQFRGVGVGLRAEHFYDIETNSPSLPWFEILSDNYLMQGGTALYHLDRIREKYPMAMHSVGMSLGASDPLNWDYFKKLKALAERIDALLISDHLCWISAQQEYLHELLPLPFTESSVAHVASRILQVQDFLGRRIAIENVSSYFTYQASEMQEWEYLTAVAELADCDILLDINNIYVSAQNHQFSAEKYLQAIPKARVKQFHLAGFSGHGSYLLDDHGSEVKDAVWSLYEKALQRFGEVPTLIEWDTHIPPFSVLEAQAQKAKTIMDIYSMSLVR